MTQQIRRPFPAVTAALASRPALALAPLAAALALLALAFVVAFAAPRRAHAEPSAEAEQLFRDGRQLLKDGKLDLACQAFAASQQLEPKISTLLNLASCQEKAQRYASAWGHFVSVESQTRLIRSRDPRDELNNANHRTARDRAAALYERLSYLTVNVPDESRVEGLLVTRDGVEVPSVQWNRAVPVDGGAHVISGKAPGHESWSTTVQLGVELDRRAVEVPRFKELPKLAQPQLGLSAARLRSAGEEDAVAGELAARSPTPSPFTPRRKLALGLGAGSVVVAGVAIGFGLAATSDRDEAERLCPPGACTPAGAEAAQRKNDTARRHALTANLGYAVAGSAALAAVVLWFTSGPERPAASVSSSSSEASASSSASRTKPTFSLSPLLGDAHGVALTGGF